MANWLGKTKTLDLVSPSSPGTPGTPGTPYRAAWVEYVTRYWVPANPYDPASVGHWEYTPSGYSQSPDIVAVNHAETPAISPIPPTPPTPAIWGLNFSIGWNAGAQSTGLFVGNLAYSFTVPTDVAGVQTGISQPSHNLGYTGYEIDYAWSASQGEAKVLENGIFKTNGFAFTWATTFKIDRTDGVVTYWLDDVLKYTSTIDSISFCLIADCSLYAGGIQSSMRR